MLYFATSRDFLLFCLLFGHLLRVSGMPIGAPGTPDARKTISEARTMVKQTGLVFVGGLAPTLEEHRRAGSLVPRERKHLVY